MVFPSHRGILTWEPPKSDGSCVSNAVFIIILGGAVRWKDCRGFEGALQKDMNLEFFVQRSRSRLVQR